MTIKQGFGLIEVLVAVLVLGISSAALVQYQQQQVRMYEEADLSKQAARIANNELDILAAKMQSSVSMIACPAPHIQNQNDTDFTIECANDSGSVPTGTAWYEITVSYPYRGDDASFRSQRLRRFLMPAMGGGTSQ